MRYCFVLIILTLALQLSAFAGGNGSSANPYQVSTLTELQDVGNYLSSYFIQTADIDATDTANWNGGDGFLPIGNDAAPFTGQYNGQRHTISNLTINRGFRNDVGLFGCMLYSTIKNVILVQGNVTGDSRVGLLAGNVYSSRLSQCITSGTVQGDWSAGGVVGKTWFGTFYNCCSSVDVNGVNNGAYTGGLVGRCGEGTYINYCYATGNVTGDDQVGGLVGTLEGTTAYHCYSCGAVACAAGLCGGLAADSLDTATIMNCLWDTEASGQSTSAGGEGKTTAEMTYFYTYHAAGWDFVAESRNGNYDIWDFDMSGAVNDGYPCLAWENSPTCLQPPAGSGTEADPYLIATLYDLWWISANRSKWDMHHRQTADIDATDTQNWYGGTGFYPIGESGYTFGGSYNGDEHTIDGLFSHQDYINAGLFGSLSYATVENLSLTNADIEADDTGGVLVALAFDATITNCHTSGAVHAHDAGGLIGSAKNSSQITRCSSSADVDGVNKSGGLAGYLYNAANIYECFATGNVDGDHYAGGLCAYLSIACFIDDCYSTGSVGGDVVVGGLCGDCSSSCVVTDSFWDVETSGMSTGIYGTGLTTAQMQTAGTFLDAGWDFAGETANGTEETWVISANAYPTFACRVGGLDIVAADDVPGDQGHQLDIVWTGSGFDTDYSPSNFYSLWRLVEDTRALDPAAVVIESAADFVSPEEGQVLLLHQRDDWWHYLATVPAICMPQYSNTIATPVDSCAALSPEQYEETYHVLFHYQTAYLTSDEATGYSVDNIPPYPTRNVQAVVNTGSRNPSMTLAWDEVSQGGLNGNSYPEQNGVWYRVYGGTTPNFACDNTSLIATTQGTTLDVDISGETKRFFKVVVSDQP